MTRSDLLEALERTWPPMRRIAEDGFAVRIGAGGGKRVSSAYFDGDTPEQISDALDLISRQGVENLFQVTASQYKIDTKLANLRFRVVDPTLLFTRSLIDSNAVPPLVTTFSIWPPLQIIRDIWATGGIDADRVLVMERATSPKTSLLGRIENRAAGAAFVAIYGDIAMLHALEVAPKFRRLGLARHLTHAAMDWARDHGASTFALAVTESNLAARDLYTSLGMTIADRYHYRIKP